MDPLTLEAPLNPDVPLDPSNPGWIPAICWVGPRHLAGDDGRLYDTVADTLTAMGWTSLTMVRGLREPDEAPEDRQVVRSTVLHLSPDTLRWAQWVLADEPFLLGDLPIAWYRPEQTRAVRSRSGRRTSPPMSPGRPSPTSSSRSTLAGIPQRRAVAPSWSLRPSPGTAGSSTSTSRTRERWTRPLPPTSAFSSGVPHDLVAAFARSVSSTAPVLRRVLPESTRDRLLRAPAI